MSQRPHSSVVGPRRAWRALTATGFGQRRLYYGRPSFALRSLLLRLAAALSLIVLVVTGSDKGLSGTAPKFRGIEFDWIAFVNAVITFLLTAAALYFLVVFPMNKLAERRRRGEEPPPSAPSEEIKLLTEIRDALVAAGHRTPAQQRGALDDVLGRNEPPSGR